MATTALVSELSFAPHLHGMAAALLFLLFTTVAAEATGARQNVHDTAQTTIARVNNVQAVRSFQTSCDLVCVSTQVIQPPPSHKPPARVLISTPTHNGSYPVVLFKHGFLIPNCFYTQLFESLASSGYIIVAPQAFSLLDCTEEIDETAAVANWISESLAVVLDAAIPSANVTPNLSQLVMAGHSKGGKIAFALALGKASIEIIPIFSALVAFDPVDCLLCKVRTYPVLVDAGGNHTRNNMSVPVLILGAGYGSKKDICHLNTACAPACCNHQAFFNCSSASTIYHLVAAHYGHLDFLNDGLARLTDLACIGGSPKADLRDFSTELVVAFLESALEGKQASIESIVENWKSAPVALEEPEVYRERMGTCAQERAQRVCKTFEEKATS